MSAVAGDSALQSEVLEDLSDAVHYRRWLADLIRPHLGERPLEIGGGLGDYAAEWLPGAKRYTVTEADPTRLAALRARFAADERVTVRELALPIPAGTRFPTDHTAAVGCNVLEHIADHVGALRSLAGLVEPGGRVVMLVPAMPSAMSAFDRAIGHQRRYTVASLRSAFVAAGLDVEVCRYLNPIGLLAWYAGPRLLGMTPHNGPALRSYDRIVVPVARLLDRVRLPFGQSVLAVGRVPA